MSEPYNYIFVSVQDSAGYYTFTTKADTEYRIAFHPDETLSSCVKEGTPLGNIYQISVYIASGNGNYDSGTSKTITSIIEAFFANDQDALLYVCDDTDNKGSKRFRHFDMWYNDSSMTDYITKLDNIIPFSSDDEEPLITIHTSLLYHNNNTNKANIHYAYYNIKKVVNGEKPDNEAD